MPAPSIDPLAIDSRGWNPRHYDEMWWEDEPMFAFIAPPALHGATKAKILAYAGSIDHGDIIGEAEFVNLRIRRIYFRWEGPARAYEFEVEHCRCQDNAIWYECPIGEAMCGRHRTDIADFWGEGGEFCPWVRCDRSDSRAVKWIAVWDAFASGGPRR